MNHAPAILAALALIYSMHRLLVLWIVAIFHLCSLVGRYTVLEVWAVRRPMRVCCGSRRGRCVLFINILDGLTAPCLVYNTAMYTVHRRCGQYGRCMFIHWLVRPVRGLYRPKMDTQLQGLQTSTTEDHIMHLFSGSATITGNVTVVRHSLWELDKITSLIWPVPLPLGQNATHSFTENADTIFYFWWGFCSDQ